MNHLPLSIRIVSLLSLALLLGEANPASTRSTLRLQVGREIQVLEDDERRDAEQYEQLQARVRQTRSALEATRAAYRDTLATRGKDDPHTLQAARAVEQARLTWYTTMSQRDHALYQMNVIAKGIEERRLLLQIKEAKAR